ncbi:MAG: polyketide synthase dehydratase domain-containing protein, partial [Pseudonocardiaceae bacterium]
SAHPVLVPALHDILGDTEAVVVGSLRRDEGSLDRLVRSAAEAYTRGVDVDWTEVVPVGRVIPLPTYAFQRERFWPQVRGVMGDVSRWGALDVAHSLLGVGVALADSGGVVFSGRLSAGSPGWLADHGVLGSVLVPGTAFVEMAVRAGDQVGCGVVRELTLRESLVLPQRGGVVVQVAVSGEDERGVRELSVHARPDGGAEQDWTLHATGVLGIASVTTQVAADAWSIAGAEVLVSAPDGVASFYDRAAALGYEYGPAFRGVRGIWRAGDAVLVEAALPDAVAVEDGIGLHPALLDAVLHAIGSGDWFTDTTPRLPFAWSGVRLHATGAREVRARITAAGPDAVEVRVTDLTGQPVMTIDSLVLRPVRADQLSAVAAGVGLYRVNWQEIATPDPVSVDDWGVLGHLPGVELRRCESVAELGSPTVTVLSIESTVDPVGSVQGVLEVVREWLACGVSGRLLVVTRNAVAVDPGDDVENPVAAGVWGLVRSAQQENPGRIVLLDVDRYSPDLLPMVAGEPQLALRRGTLRVPRLVAAERALTPPSEAPWRLDIPEQGTLDNLVLAPHPEALEPLAPGEVRIHVRAAGINFRDVVVSLGLVPHLDGVG